jgi:NAD(P)-dependent dehydrogenase (short-subunit alcohol dehydrogenase family)
MTSYISPDLTGTSIRTLMDLSGRTAVVTGGARGIGYAICDRLAEAGASVLLADLDETAARAAADIISRRWSADVRPHFVDVTIPSTVDELADVGDSTSSGLTIWVNNAGTYPSTPLVDISDAEWERTLRITLDGTFYGCRAAARRMVARAGVPGRVIINMSSLSGLRGRPNLAGYVASKHGVTGLVRALAVELGKSGVRVVGIAPSVVDTPGMRLRRDTADPAEAERLRRLEDAAVSHVPAGRVGTADDVARTALYLASDLSEFVTGVIIPVDGGVNAG